MPFAHLIFQEVNVILVTSNVGKVFRFYNFRFIYTSGQNLCLKVIICPQMRDVLAFVFLGGHSRNAQLAW